MSLLCVECSAPVHLECSDHYVCGVQCPCCVWSAVSLLCVECNVAVVWGAMSLLCVECNAPVVY